MMFLARSVEQHSEVVFVSRAASKRRRTLHVTISIFGIISLGFPSTPFAAQKNKEAKDTPPQVVVAMPLALEPGKTTKLTLRGVKFDNITEIRLHEPKSTGKVLGKGKKVPVPNNANAAHVGDSEIDVEITLPREVAGSTVSFSVIGPGGESKPHRVIVKDDTPIVAEKEPNDGFKNAQAVTWPCVIEGSIRQPQDVDAFRFDGKEGERLHFELQANRFGSPVDGILTLYDDAGRVLAIADDSPQSIDPILTITLPKTGSYHLALLDAHDQGGSIYLYRLIIRSAK
jgi:hypothetical protein